MVSQARARLPAWARRAAALLWRLTRQAPKGEEHARLYRRCSCAWCRRIRPTEARSNSWLCRAVWCECRQLLRRAGLQLKLPFQLFEARKPGCIIRPAWDEVRLRDALSSKREVGDGADLAARDIQRTASARPSGHSPRSALRVHGGFLPFTPILAPVDSIDALAYKSVPVTSGTSRSGSWPRHVARHTSPELSVEWCQTMSRGD